MGFLNYPERQVEDPGFQGLVSHTTLGSPTERRRLPNNPELLENGFHWKLATIQHDRQPKGNVETGEPAGQ